MKYWLRQPKYVFRHIRDRLFKIDKKWIALSANVAYSKLSMYLKELYTNVELKKINQEANEILFRSNIISKSGGFDVKKMEVLYLLARASRPDVVVETGVANGFSTLHILSALERNQKGILHSIDLPSINDRIDGEKFKKFIPDGRKSGWIVPGHLRKIWHLELGDTKKVLPNLLRKLGTIDIFIHDSKHTYKHMMFEYETSWPHIREGGFLLSDDIDSNTAYFDFLKKIKYSSSFVSECAIGIIKK